MYFLTTADSTAPAALLQWAVARPVDFHHRRQIGFGARILGRIAGEAVRDRVSFIADTLLFPNGLELPMNASAVEADDSGGNVRSGVAAYYFPPPSWAQLAPYVSEAFFGAAGFFESQLRSQISIGPAGLTVQPAREDGARSAALEASAHAIRDFTRGRLAEIERRYRDCSIVPAGTACWLQLASDLDLRAAHVPRAPLPRSPQPAAAPNGPP